MLLNWYGWYGRLFPGAIEVGAGGAGGETGLNSGQQGKGGPDSLGAGGGQWMEDDQEKRSRMRGGDSC